MIRVFVFAVVMPLIGSAIVQGSDVTRKASKAIEGTESQSSGIPRPAPPPDLPCGTSASGDDGRVSVTVSAQESTVAPGEIVQIHATSNVLVDGPLRFPQGYHQPLALLYLQTPTGKVIVHPEKGVSPKSCRPLAVADYQRPNLFGKGARGVVLSCDFPLVNPSPDWLDPRSFEPIRPDLRTEGVYEVWVKYTIPKIEGVPADAWHGSVESNRVRVKVREVSVADRRSEATAEQIAHLEAYIKYMDAVLVGKDVEPPMPKAVEMPYWLSLERRLQWALEKTENEGFARYVVALLRKNQPKDKEQPYPIWWDNIGFLIQSRAYFDRGYGEKAIKIFGPYLDEYALVAADEMERALAGHTPGPSGYAPARHTNLLLDFAEYKPKSPVRQRLETIARGHAKIPDGAKPGDRKLRDSLAVSWKLLYALDILHDGMSFTEAKNVLGKPTARKDVQVDWNYGTASRRFENGVRGRIVFDGNGETIVFINRNDWVPIRRGR